MAGYEYIRLRFDWGDLKELNGLGSVGWHVVSVTKYGENFPYGMVALLERALSTQEGE